MNDFLIPTKEIHFSPDEEIKFNKIMPNVIHLLRYSRLGECIQNNIIMPDAFRLRKLKSGKLEKTISLFQMLQIFSTLEEESQSFLNFLSSKPNTSFIFDDKTRTIRLIREKLRKACMKNKEMLDLIEITQTTPSKSSPIAHHWDIRSNNFDAIYHILSDCSEIIDHVYSYNAVGSSIDKLKIAN
ncbi:hypothetical protein CEP48_00335 [Mergibacter septicus]|uniref:Uncharacterized protein n=1 Tax=Mergibacter septicus TaxID=221402 RepID=A0A8E3MFM2_9PAST|nr:hypothetical protein [Mergibacter septicus]AWX14728.1 hypothetical protein CEP47_00335 [Mergibacter septicus]QDJ13979.1 hypothetical protein CEP48_00335 [Mergibacter septicus]UTU48572.1 hypothetical protein HLL31_07295 [Mergibacter septicus]WMR95799.1 hypothetical protein RDJ12_07705 [Mergibacter septicus]